MVTYERVKHNAAIFRYLTGLSVKEFEELVPLFEAAWNNFVRRTFIEGRQRKRAYGGGNTPKLKNIRDKLVFILCYYRVYPLQFLQGLLFGLDTSNANRWIHRLSPLLKETLGYEKKLPARERRGLDDILQECPEIRHLLIDGTERRIKRPQDDVMRKVYYSGKKRAHTVKNILITDGEQRVRFLSKTVEGKKHDKKLADEEHLRFPRDTHLLGDLGFENYKTAGVIMHHPKKKPKGKQLAPLEKSANRAFSGLRVLVEHGIRGVKISRIAQDIYRNYKKGFEDELMEVACGLHNYRISKRIT